MFKKKNFIALVFLLGFVTSVFAYDVMFNTKTRVYHDIQCKWAIKCTKNCIRIDHTEALRRGGVPCKVCGGTEQAASR